MKAFFISTFIVILIGAIYFGFMRKYETYEYEVLESFDEFEIRLYRSALFTEVEIASDNYKSASSQGFRILAGYIFGGNEKEESIAMTTPVAMELSDSITMRFLVPAEYSKTTLPNPNDKRIVFKEQPAKIVAAIQFSGWANDQKIDKYKSKLAQALKKEGLAHRSTFTFLGYNAPYDPVNRRNEVIVELIDYQK